MDDDELRATRSPDPAHLVAAIAAAGGPRVELAGQLPGGSVGAWLVQRADGTRSVLTWSPPAPFGIAEGAFDAARALMEVAAGAGVPLPRYEDVVDLPDGSVAVLQEHVMGTAPTAVTPALLEHAVALADLRRGLASGAVGARESCALHLTAPGPGFCHHEPLRRHGPETRALLGRIESVGRSEGDTLDGTDVLHFDYTFANVLVGDDPDRVVAVVDWDGARPGRLVLDLVILRFDLSWRAPDLGDRLERTLVDDPGFLRAWAHQSLRLVDWSIRHEPEPVVDHFVGLARRHL